MMSPFMRIVRWVPLAILAAVLVVVFGAPRFSMRLAQVAARVDDARPRDFSAGWRDPDGGGAIDSAGTVDFSDDLSAVTHISDGGFLNVESGTGFSSRRVEISAANGSMTGRDIVDGASRPWSADTDRWLARELPRLVRRSGVGAEGRVRRLMASGGVAAVAAEIERLATDSVRGPYLRALIATGTLNDDQSRDILTLAGDVLTSRDELAQLLERAAAAGVGVNAGFQHAFGAMTSSAEQARVLKTLLQHGAPLTADGQMVFLAMAADIESNAECAAVLAEFSSRYGVAPGRVQRAFFDALDTVDSNAERERLLASLPFDTRP
jgi:hypothetical protein